jgi:large repetitive protein
MSATGQQSAITNYFIGQDSTKWHTNVPNYASIAYQQLYPGIDLGYDGTDGHLKSTYTIAAGTDPNRLLWRYIGAKGQQIDIDFLNVIQKR